MKGGIVEAKKYCSFRLQKPLFKFGNVVIVFLCPFVKGEELTADREVMKKQKNLNKEGAR